MNTINIRRGALFGIGAVSFGAGLAAGYFLARRKETIVEVAEEVTQLEFDFDAVVKDVVDDMKQVVQDLTYEVDRVNDEEADAPVSNIDYHLMSAKQAHPSSQTEEEEDDEGQDIAPVVNIFASAASSDDWDYDAEVDSRRDKEAYIIHQDEFYEDENGWENQQTLTFYAGDQVLCTVDDVPVHDGHRHVGENLKFGHGSSDPNVVYIRNERLQVEYEVVRDPGSYEHHVLGGRLAEDMEEQDLKHSRYPARFREQD